MATPEAHPELLRRLIHAEDAVQRFEFSHMVKTDAQTTGMAILYSQQQRLQLELSGFRAEVTTELETIKTEQTRQGGRLEAIEAEQARQGEKLASIESAVAEILRRLPE